MAFGGQDAHGLVLGTEITIPDTLGNDNPTSWYYKLKEDEEVEPNCLTGQVWDLEGFFRNGTWLYMVGGFDFKNGVNDPYRSGVHYSSGDLFVGTPGVTKYDYAFVLDFVSSTYKLYQLNNASLLKVYFDQNYRSNPWRYQSGGTQVGIGNFSYFENPTIEGVSLTGDKHYVVAINLAGLNIGSGLRLFHYTYQCGNDLLMGQANANTFVPEPSTIFLLGVGLAGIGVWRRKKGKVA